MAPWDELRAAEARLTAAARGGDPLERAAAEHAVEAARTACGALFAELLLHADATDGVRDRVWRTLAGLGLPDDDARALCEDLGRCVEYLTEQVAGLVAANRELRREMAGLRSQLEAVLYEREQERPVAGYGPADGRGRGRRAGVG